MKVPENKVLVDRYKLKADSAHVYPVGSVVKAQKGQEFEGPAIVTILDRELRLQGGLEPANGGDEEEAAEGEGEEGEGDEAAEGEGEEAAPE